MSKEFTSMKKTYLLMGLLASGLTFTSCNDLDQEPSTELPASEAITTVTDLQNAVNGVAYSMIDGYDGERFTYATEFTLFGDIRTNDYRAIVDYGQITNIERYSITKNDAFPEAAFHYFYATIADINKTLEESAKLSDDDAKVKNLKGQLYAWRGLLHFDLARIFAHIPTTVSDKNAANSGIVISDKVFPANYKPTRATLQETYDFIINDLTTAANMMADDKDNEGPTTNVGSLSYWAAVALRARAYLYMGEYDKALADAKEVINSGRYQLYTRNNYATVWGTEGTSESIFEIQTSTTHNGDRYSTGYYLDESGYSEAAFNESSKLFKYLHDAKDTTYVKHGEAPAKSLFETDLEVKASEKPDTDMVIAKINTSDIRRNLVKDQTSSDDAPGYYSGKYPGRGSIYVNNPKVVRLSEMYLIAAESEYYLHGGAAAAQWINKLEENRKANYTDVASVTLDDILFEYEMEFFTENQIAFAYWRNKRSVTSTTGTEIKYDAYNNIFPIPQREIDLNNNLTQNPEY